MFRKALIATALMALAFAATAMSSTRAAAEGDYLWSDVHGDCTSCCNNSQYQCPCFDAIGTKMQ
jgi:CDP-diacylglycerol pyrophosphatase